MRQLLLVVGAALITASPIVLQAQDTTKPASAASTAATKLVTGKVTNEKGLPLEDVTVQIKGSRTSTKTNSSGSYNINVPENGVLVFSFVGMAKEELSTAGKTSVDLQMKPAADASLEEVIVVGYGSQKAREVTGATATVDLKKVQDIPTATVAEALKGQMPGVSISGGSTRPGSTPNLSVRQQFNLGKDGGNAFPLVVIDDVIQVDANTGLPTLERFNLLDMSEVESVTVLKDASAAIYGSRASQGAIVIKTKRGKSGLPRLTYTGKFERMDAVSHGKVMNAQEYGKFSNRYVRAAQISGASGWDTLQHMFTPAELASMGNINYDWLKNDWRAAGTMQHSLDVSGGSDRATYFMGGSYFTQGANLGAQDFKRYTFRAGSDVKVVNNLRLSATIAANNTDLEKSFTKININDSYASGGEQRDYSLLLHMPKYIPWQYTVNGVPRWVSPVRSVKDLGNANGSNVLSSWNYYASLNNGSKTTTKTFNYNVNFSLQYDVPFIKGLSVKASYATNSSVNNTEQVQQATAFSQPVTAAPSNFNTSGNHLYTPALTWSAPILNRSGSRVAYISSTGVSTQSNFVVNYDNTFGDHKVAAVFSGERARNDYEQKQLYYENPIPGAYNGTSASAGTMNTGNTVTNRTESGILSYLGRVSYGYKGRYLAQFIFRRDASTRFAPENRWGFFPGITAGWIISDETWFRHQFPAINSFKLRGSLGKTGNDNVKAWKWMQLYKYETDKGMGFGSAGGTMVGGITPEVSPNRDVRWDRTIQRNLGIDMSLLKNRLSFSIDGYYNTSTDMLTNMSSAINVPVTVGGAFAEQNYAGVKAWGTEISVNWKSTVNKDFSYAVGMNFGWGDNKVTRYVDQAFAYPSTTTTRLQVNQSTNGPAWGYRTWKNTSSGDGMLRTDADIDNYWAYLTDNAAKSGVAGAAPQFFDYTTKTSLRKGMLAFEDVAGAIDYTKNTIAGPNGKIDDTGEDFVKLKKKNVSYSINTNLSATYKGIYFQAQIVTSWGGLNTMDVVKQSYGSANSMYAQPIVWNDMYDQVDNPNGAYPNLYYYDDFGGANSDFFMLPSFRSYVRSMSVGYSIPKSWAQKAHVESARLFLSGNNLWDFYNPYPQKFRNMYDNATVDYPTLRTWALGVNLVF